MSGALSIEAIEELWQSFKTADPEGRDEITLKGLRRVMESLGHRPTDEQLRHMLFDAQARGAITFDKFVALLTSLRGDSVSRLRLAFAVLDEKGTGLVTREALGRVLGRFGLTDQELDQIFALADQDGDGAIDFDEFCSLMPHEHELAGEGYQDTHRHFAGRQRVSPIR